MKTKKLAIIGRGTAGALSASFFSFRLQSSEIDWYYDPDTPTQPVGEGSNSFLPHRLYTALNFTYEDLLKIDGTIKTGIEKEGWGKGKLFYHNFFDSTVGYHFNAIALQDYILNKLREVKNIKVIEQKIFSDNIDADYILDCSGTPKNLNDFEIVSDIPVNSVYVTQCYWDAPEFLHTKTVAKKHGWVFGIPLHNRCSIGYLYNKDISSLEEIKEDVQEIFYRFNLTPSDNTNNFSFKSYYRKNNFSKRIAYNGNASFFLEPLEATSTHNMDMIDRELYDILVYNKNYMSSNLVYSNYMQNVKSFLMLHYFSGSKYKSPFWEYATYKGEQCIIESFKNKNFYNIIKACEKLLDIDDGNIIRYKLETIGNYLNKKLEYSPLLKPLSSYYYNIKGLEVDDKLKKFISYYADVAQG